MVADSAVTAIVLVCTFVGLLFAALYSYHLSLISVKPSDDGGDSTHDRLMDATRVREQVYALSGYISEGANAFLFKEYQWMGAFCAAFCILLFILLGAAGHSWVQAIFTCMAFLIGAMTSVVSGFIGMRVAVYSNSRTAIKAQEGYSPAFVTAFKAGSVMGFALVSLGLLVLYILINLFHLHYSSAFTSGADVEETKRMYEAIAGYGLGGSSVALFGRVGGGIYTKAADVGADLVGKVEFKMNEDSPKNPAVIADNVGDNVGDIAGMGADLFGSFAESTCAAMVIASQSSLFNNWLAMSFPLVLAATGIVGCLLTSFVATHILVVKEKRDIEPSLKRQILVSTLVMTPVIFLVTYFFLPSEFAIGTPGAVAYKAGVKNWHIFFCVICGLWSGMVIGYITEYYTSNFYTPVKEVANACGVSAASNIIYGLALGYKSVIIPVFAIAITIYVGYSLAGMFGIACGALGILSTLATGLTIDAYGPICDNAGGIAEMAGMHEDVRTRTDALDAAGNTTAAIGKGFAIGSAALVSLALFGAFVTTVQLDSVDLLKPFEFAGLLVGAMLPYWFSALTMKSVGLAANEMAEEVRKQIRDQPALVDPNHPDHETAVPDYQACVAISTAASLREMMAPGALVMLTPIIVGFLFGVQALAGVLAGALVSGVQMAISSSNTGGAWDNAKKYIEGQNLEFNGRMVTKEDRSFFDPIKANAVIGDTVGDPLKDTSGPSLNILIKLMAIISLVFGPSFPSVSAGGYLEQLFHA